MSKRVFFLFLDGVGLGANDPATNPLARAHMPTLRTLLGGHIPTIETPNVNTPLASSVPTNATLGVPGRPQSATGQATILTGENVPALIGEHYGPRPDHRIRPLLERGTFLHRLRDAGKRIAFANAYPERYFRGINSGKRVPGAMAYAARAAGIPLRTAQDLAEARALSVDFTNRAWRERLGYADMPLRTARECGRIVAALLREHDLVMFEQWATDMLGHQQDWEGAIALLEALDEFLGGLMEEMDGERDVLVVTSDHGNLEDMRTRQHTLNPVPTIIVGKGHEAMAARVATLCDIHALMCDLLLTDNVASPL